MRRSKLEEARGLRAAVAELARASGADHPRTVEARLALAEACRHVCEYDDPGQQEWEDAGTAELGKAVDSQVRTLGAEHPETLANREKLAMWRWALDPGHRDELVAELESIAAGRERVLGVRHRDTLETWKLLEGRLAEPGRSALRRRILEGWEAAFETGAVERTTAARRLAALYEEFGQPEQALAMRRWSVDHWGREAAERARRLGPVHPETVAARKEHALHVRWLGDAAEAGRLSERIAADQERFLGADDPATLHTRAENADRDHQYRLGDPGFIAAVEELITRVPDVADRRDLRFILMHAYHLRGRHDDLMALVTRYPLPEDEELEDDEPERDDAQDCRPSQDQRGMDRSSGTSAAE